MSAILATLKTHRLDAAYLTSAGITLADPAEKVQLITSLKEAQFFDTMLSWAVVIEMVAAFGVGCMAVTYAFKGCRLMLKWWRSRR